MVLRGDQQLSRAEPPTGLEFNRSITFDGRATKHGRVSCNGGFVGKGAYVEIILGSVRISASSYRAEYRCSAFVRGFVGNTDQIEVVRSTTCLWKFGIEFSKGEVPP